MNALEKKVDELFTYLKENMLTKTEFKDSMDDIAKRFEALESKVTGAHNRIDKVYETVQPVEQLIPLITKDFYKRFVEVEEKVKDL